MFSGDAMGIEKAGRPCNLPNKPESSLDEAGRRTITTFSSAMKIVFCY
jgi:hypothetical protein